MFCSDQVDILPHALDTVFNIKFVLVTVMIDTLIAWDYILLFLKLTCNFAIICSFT